MKLQVSTAALAVCSAVTVALLSVDLSPVSAEDVVSQTCLDPTALRRLDGEWERSLLESDLAFLRTILAEDFVWVHNHASGIDTRDALLARAADPAVGASGAPRSRVSSDVEVRVLGSTGVVSGFTVVDRGPGPTRYHFMRTYVEAAGRCVLLANHTMEVPEGGP